jgi:putative Mg2+ transporter-C (MgtC) family protein
MSVWSDIVHTTAHEFSDLGDTGAVVRVSIRLVVASVLGGILGFEREVKGKSAGLRTHMLVALGSAVFVLVPEQLGTDKADMTRVLQGLVAGIGFLGAGAILKHKEADEVKGLTTAASIWLTAAIGMSAGMGRELTAILSTILAMIVLTVMPIIASGFQLKSNSKEKGDADPQMPKDPNKRPG